MEFILAEQGDEVVDIGNGLCLNPASESSRDGEIKGFQPFKIVNIDIDAREAGRIYLDWNNWPGQRRIDMKRVEEYSRRMGAKLWHHTAISVALIVDQEGDPVLNEDNDQCAFIINGQHTLKSVIKSAGWINLTFHFYELTERELDLLFSQFDDHKVRRNSDILTPISKTFGTVEKKVRGEIVEKPIIKSGILETIGKAVYWVDFGGFKAKYKAPSKDILVKIIDRNREFVEWLISICSDPSKPFAKSGSQAVAHLWRIGPVALMYHLWKSGDRQKAYVFFKSLLADREYESGNPIDELKLTLSEHRTREHWDGKQHSKIAQAVAHAFNHYVNHRDISTGYQVPVDRIKSMDDSELAFFNLETIETDSDAIGTEVVVDESEIDIKTGSLDQRSTIEDEETVASH